MNRFSKNVLAGLMLITVPLLCQAKQWSLQDCISYALQNNITLQKNRLTKQSSTEDLLASKSALLPSLNA